MHDNYIKNKEKKLADSKIYYANKRLERKATRARYYKNNKEAVKERVMRYHAAHPSMRRVAVANRRHRLRGRHTVAEVMALWEVQAGLCANPDCACVLKLEDAHIDHKEPVIRGGSNTIENLQWLCADCNLEKAQLSYSDWLLYLTLKKTWMLCP